MKHSQHYYQNRSKIHQLNGLEGKFRPTVEDCREWFNILNEQVFGNKLPEISEIKVKRLKDTHAYYNYWRKCDKQPRNETSLDMNVVFESKKLFVEILGHEMIHHFQLVYDEPLGHGPTFWAWSDNFNLKGLTLHKVA